MKVELRIVALLVVVGVPGPARAQTILFTDYDGSCFPVGKPLSPAAAATRVAGPLDGMPSGFVLGTLLTVHTDHRTSGIQQLERFLREGLEGV